MLRRPFERLTAKKGALSKILGEFDGEDHFQDRQASTLEDRRERQTLQMCQMPETKPKTREGAGPVVLPDLPEAKT
jgi:hypothetical protein